MKKIILRILAALTVIFAVIFIVASTKPDTFRIERSTRIKASSEKVAVLISDFHKWNTWSPFEKLDPAMKRTFSGSEAGIGAVYEWEGNSDAGSGRMEVLDASPSKITIKLDFLKPFEAHNTAEFMLEPVGEYTKVT